MRCLDENVGLVDDVEIPRRMDDGVDLSGDVLSGCQEVAERLRIVSGIGRVETIEWTTDLISAATFSVAAKK